MIAWVLFYNPAPLDSNGWTLWLLLPLCMSVAIVYKTIRVEDVRRLPVAIVLLMGYILAGLVALSAALWVIQAL